MSKRLEERMLSTLMGRPSSQQSSLERLISGLDEAREGSLRCREAWGEGYSTNIYLVINLDMYMCIICFKSTSPTGYIYTSLRGLCVGL